MKGKILPVLLLLFIVSVASLSAEKESSEYYVKTVYLVRVYNNNLGFRVDYQTPDMRIQSTYMPTKWFEKSSGYGEAVYGDHATAPYMTIWYKDNKIDHFRLYVKQYVNDPSWGSFNTGEVSEADFDVEELKIVYQ